MDVINKIKEWLSNPKKKSLTLLGIYFIFFVVVFILTSGGNSETPNYVEKEQNNNIISNYNYIYRINNNEVINEISGTYKDNIDTFNYNGLNYTKNDGFVYLNNNQVQIDFDIDRYKYDKIQTLIDNSDSKTTYQDSKKIVYNMNIVEYFTLLNETNNCTSIDCSYINVSIAVESNDYINNVIIDLSNYYGYKYTIEINYDNINKISTN